MDTKHYVAGGVYAKEWRGNAGDFIEQHKHNYDHLSYLACGQVAVEVDGEYVVYTGPTGINIKAHKAHKVTAITPGVLWLCIHSIPADLRDADCIEQSLIAD